MTDLVVSAMLFLSILLQVIAAAIALSLIRVTTRRGPWVAIAIAILLMAVRRSITFSRLISGDLAFPPDPSAESVALLISILMLTGLATIRPMLKSMSDSAKTLRDSKEELDRTHRIAHLGTWHLDLARDELRWSEEIYGIYGLPKDVKSSTHMEFLALVHPDDRNTFAETFRRSREAGTPSDLVHRIQRPDGTVRVVRNQWEHIVNEEGEVIASRGTVLDVTDLRTTRQALSESQRMLRLVLDAIPVRVFWKNRDSVYLGCNARFAADAGLGHADEVVGKDDFDLPWKGAAETYRANDRAVMESAENRLNFEGPQRLPNGTVQWLRLSKIPLRDADGVVIGVMGVYEDITEQQQADEERDELETQLRQHQKLEAIGRLAGGIAHDLNNLLSPILGYSELLLEDLDADDERRESVEGIMSAGVDARDLVGQLLAFSRKQALEYRPADLNQALEEVEPLLRRTIREDIEIELLLSPELDPVMADIGQIKQVIMNLAVNSADAMPKGGRLTIETGMAYLDSEYASQLPDVESGPYVMLVVTDTGFGMDQETREQVFDPFFSTKGDLGTGLGLATVHGIVKQHGGGIRVISEPDAGCTFEIFLPVTEESIPDEDRLAVATEALPGSETILLVEDNPHVRRLTLTMLERLGYTVLAAEDGNSALDTLRSYEGHVDLLFTDVVMPGMDGGDLFSIVEDLYPGMKVLYMSGYIDRVIASRGVLDAGVSYLRKPFTNRTMAQKLRDALEED